MLLLISVILEIIMPWKMLCLSSEENVAKAKAWFNQSVFIDTEPYQDLDWVLGDDNVNPNVFVFLYQDNNANQGFCILRKQPRPLKMMLGEFALCRKKLTRYELWAGPLIHSDSADNEKMILREFISLISDMLRKDETLSVEGLPLKSSFYQVINEQNPNLINLKLEASYMHQFIALPKSLDDYFKQMSKNSRKSVQYSQRKIRKDYNIELFRCDCESSIQRFLDDAISISKKTYQWNLLNLGLRDRSSLKGTLHKWKSDNALRSYILYCDGKPVSFMLGYIYNTCYYYIDVGYDPDWAKYSVGSVLQIEVLEDLYNTTPPPKKFDFSTGYGEHKARFGNREQEEINMLIFKNSLPNKIIATSYVAINRLSELLVDLLEKLGVKKQIKRLIRRIS